MPLTQWTCVCHFYTFWFTVSETSDWSHFRDGLKYVDDCSSKVDSRFDLNQENSPPNHEPIQPQVQVMLEDLAQMESTISQIRDYSFNHEKSQWSEDELDSFFNPPQEMWNLDNPQLRLSFQIYLSLSAHSSESTYDAIRSSIKGCYSESTMLLFDQVRNRLKGITGILLLHFDMCVNTCLAYTGAFLPLTACLFCGECQYEQQHHDIGDPKIARCQFITLPLGPQLQALWRHPVSVAKLRDRLRRTTVLLAQHDTDGGIQDYGDVLVSHQSGKLTPNDSQNSNKF
jgi:hypothetical protein